MNNIELLIENHGMIQEYMHALRDRLSGYGTIYNEITSAAVQAFNKHGFVHDDDFVIDSADLVFTGKIWHRLPGMLTALDATRARVAWQQLNAAHRQHGLMNWREVSGKLVEILDYISSAPHANIAREIQKIIYHHPTNPLPAIQTMAESLGLTRSSACHAFREQQGMTVAEYAALVQEDLGSMARRAVLPVRDFRAWRSIRNGKNDAKAAAAALYRNWLSQTQGKEDLATAANITRYLKIKAQLPDAEIKAAWKTARISWKQSGQGKPFLIRSQLFALLRTAMELHLRNNAIPAQTKPQPSKNNAQPAAVAQNAPSTAQTAAPAAVDFQSIMSAIQNMSTQDATALLQAIANQSRSGKP